MSALSISGYASLFETEDLGGDIVASGAFTASLRARRRIPMLYQHDAAAPVGAWTQLVEDHKGLHVEGQVFDQTPQQAALIALLRAGAVDGLSIGFRTRRSSARPGGGRRLFDIDLWEVSIVTFPMLPQARLRLDPAAVLAA